MKWSDWILMIVFNLAKSWLTALSHGSHSVTVRPSWVASRHGRTFFSRFLRSLLPLPLAAPSSFPRNHTAKKQVHHSWCKHEEKQFPERDARVRDNNQRVSGESHNGPFWRECWRLMDSPAIKGLSRPLVSPVIQPIEAPGWRITAFCLQSLISLEFSQQSGRHFTTAEDTRSKPLLQPEWIPRWTGSSDRTRTLFKCLDL